MYLIVEDSGKLIMFSSDDYDFEEALPKYAANSIITKDDYICNKALNMRQIRAVLNSTKTQIIDVVDEYIEPVIEKTSIEILQEENILLKAQVNALATNQEFLENCLMEVGQVIYA